MGYLYGPQSRDLKAYKQSFNLFRPYYSGPEQHRANFLHYTDAATALTLVVENQPTNQIFNLVDGYPASFGDFIDTFASYLCRLKPFHIPRWSAPLAELITIRPAQVTLLDLTTLVSAAKFSSQLGWEPRYPTYRDGLAQVVQSWKGHDVHSQDK
jgi:nucleoside-diphosphate-sugar epimerase